MGGLLIIALAPVFIIAFYIYFRDKYEKEPWQLLAKAMLLGVFIALPVIYAEKLMQLLGSSFTGVMKGFWHAFFVAALCEEAFKLAALYLLIWSNREFNEKFDGIVYAAFISLGFAGIENILYVMNSGVSTGLMRAITAVPAHAIFGVSMGFFFGMAKFYPKRRNKYLKNAFLIPFILHGIYDFILMSGLNFLLILFIPFIIYMWTTGFRKLKELNKSSIYNSDIDIGLDFSKIKDYNPPSATDNK